MTWDPRLVLMRQDLSRDLGKVSAWCWHVHPGLPPHTLVAAAKFYEALGVSMEVSVAEAAHPFDDTSVVKTAEAALGALGYFTRTAGAKWTSPGIVVFAADMTAHERLAAVRDFLAIGLME